MIHILANHLLRLKMAEPVDVSKKHFYISLAKSGLRIGGCVAVLLGANILWLPGTFLAAEILGIAEEI